MVSKLANLNFTVGTRFHVEVLLQDQTPRGNTLDDHADDSPTTTIANPKDFAENLDDATLSRRRFMQQTASVVPEPNDL